MDSTELLRRLRNGDEAAFDAIFRAWYPRLVATAEKLVGTQAVAEEIVQDVLLELWRRRAQLPEDSSAPAYLFQSTRNRALNYLRHEGVKRRGEPQLRLHSSGEAPAPARLVEEEIDVALQEALVALPDRCRAVFEMSRAHGLKYAEIAEALGVSVKTVEADMGKALKSLRTRLAAWLPVGGRG